MVSTDSAGAANDTDHFGFSDEGLWSVDRDALVWDQGLHHIRNNARDSVPRLLDARRLPPIGRLLAVSSRIGWTLTMWAVFERRQEQSPRRRALSKRLQVQFAKLGPTYIKVGQIVSSGEGLFPEELVSEFKLLRDRVPAESFAHVRNVVESELGDTIETIFAFFDETPLAAASIAQVHVARLRTGEEVVVKVQRPRVNQLVRDDIRAMAWLAPKLIGRIPVAALGNPPALVELFAETIVEELDFRLEAENMLDVAAVLARTNQRAIIIPRPHPKYVTRRVLVMERLDGFAWDDVASMREVGIDTQAVLHAGLVGFMEGAMVHGVFHGDLHGGNLMVRPDGRTVLLDFGITGRMTPVERMAFLFLLVGTTTGDVRSQLGALRDLGAFPADTDLDEVFTDLGLDRPMVDPTTLSPDELLNELRELTKKLMGYGARVPKVLMLLVKNLMFLDGSIATLAPDVDIIGQLEAVHTEIALRHGETLASEMGIDMTTAVFDADAVKISMGVDPSVQSLTYRDMQERRDTIRRNIEAKRTRPKLSLRRKSK